jgi:uncharacterized membrane protein YeaQ/YmgE (transglycosylase-associated protein family)
MADLSEKGSVTSDNQPDKSGHTPLTAQGIWVVSFLAIYLLVLLLLGLNWFTGLMVADLSSQPNPATAKCAVPNTNGNTATGSNTNAGNANANQNSNSGTTAVNSNSVSPANTANANRAKANPAANSNRGDGVVPPAKSPANGETGTTPPGADPGSGLKLPSVIAIDDYSFLGFASVKSFTNKGCVTDDGYLFLIVLFAGMIGAILRALIYFCWRVGTKDFAITWMWYYIFQPFIGSALAVVVYVVVRGGFSSGAIGKGNLYAFAALAFLTALFSDNALAKLKLVAESLLVKVDPRPKPDDRKNNGQPAPPATDGKTKSAPESAPAADGVNSSGGRTPGSIAPDEPPV